MVMKSLFNILNSIHSGLDPGFGYNGDFAPGPAIVKNGGKNGGGLEQNRVKAHMARSIPLLRNRL